MALLHLRCICAAALAGLLFQQAAPSARLSSPIDSKMCGNFQGAQQPHCLQIEILASARHPNILVRPAQTGLQHPPLPTCKTASVPELLSLLLPG